MGIRRWTQDTMDNEITLNLTLPPKLTLNLTLTLTISLALHTLTLCLTLYMLSSDEKWFYGLVVRTFAKACESLGVQKQSFIAITSHTLRW